ncbi:MAG: SEL1-like repeat protein [Bacteroidales bacterium]|nr:SEL1-like repeat protein [Bacteroidales bacterium]
MIYPSVGQYTEAIKLAEQSPEDYFATMTTLRPVLGADGNPVMSSGNFAVVFKMVDQNDGKFYALKCFTRDQEGRDESYRLIADELQDVSSPYITNIQYLEKELFVDINTDENEFPVLLMDWVEGETLDKYIKNHINEPACLNLLAGRFCMFADWLLKQPFAHGDLKPDNIIVKDDGTLVIVDYDGMYVPKMRGQKARELGSPDFRHPQRTEDDFDEHIDDFAIVTLLLTIKAIALNPNILEDCNAKDCVLLHTQDFTNLAQSAVNQKLQELIGDSDFARLYAVFVVVLAERKLEGEVKSLFLSTVENVDLNELEYQYARFLSNQENGMEIDLKKAYLIFEKLASFNHIDASISLAICLLDGIGCQKDEDRGFLIISFFANKGNARAQYCLGCSYDNGEGVDQDFQKAVEWYTKAAEQGYVDAQYNLGSCYNNGEGVEQDYQKAVEWYTKAAEQGNAGALNNLGVCYANGQGVEKDYKKAVEWYTKAAEQGAATAQINLGSCYDNGEGVEQDYQKAVEWYTKAAEQGDADAQYHLGNCYWFGKGVNVNIQKAINLFGSAADHGIEAAKKELVKHDEIWCSKAIYSEDGETFEGITWDVYEYEIREGTKNIAEGACCDLGWEIDCSYFNKLTIPESVISIGDNPFGCQMAEVICRSPHYVVENQTLYTKEKKELIQCFVRNPIDSFIIPEGVEVIRNFAFYACEIKKIIIASTVKEVRSNPFVEAGYHDLNIEGCPYIFNVVSLSKLLTVCDNALYEGNKIISYWGRDKIFKVPIGIQIIGDKAFWNARFEQIQLPSSIISIGDDAFNWNEHLKSIIVPSGELSRFKEMLPTYEHCYIVENDDILPF